MFRLYCPKHPTFKGQRKPRTKEFCVGCWVIYDLVVTIKTGFIKVLKG